MDFVDLIRLDGAVQVSGGVAGGPHAAFADDAAERTLGRIVYRRGEASEVSAKAQRDVYLGFLDSMRSLAPQLALPQLALT